MNRGSRSEEQVDIIDFDPGAGYDDGDLPHIAIIV